ncbi:hypothetical protein [Oceanobacter mangrovi]|uniref:hypothetical protein n=1 Tax=Oceanobacter mangrovi TaxID=2862510 RepID=UPI001C8D8DC7|nr:hypothetical protein [Oceanobacter mangrovi]
MSRDFIDILVLLAKDVGDIRLVIGSYDDSIIFVNYSGEVETVYPEIAFVWLLRSVLTEVDMDDSDSIVGDIVRELGWVAGLVGELYDNSHMNLCSLDSEYDYFWSVCKRYCNILKSRLMIEEFTFCVDFYDMLNKYNITVLRNQANDKPDIHDR